MVLEGDYGMYTWPSAPVLGQYVWYNKKNIIGKHCLEIGAGTALAGVVAAKVGAKVTLSDAAHLPQCLENCRKTCEANDVNDVKIIGLTWGEFSPQLLELEPVDVILGADCFYDSKDFEDILVTIAYLMEKNPKAEFWTSYQERSSGRCIEHLMMKWGLVGVEVPLQDFEADKDDIAESGLPGDHTIKMFVITKGTE